MVQFSSISLHLAYPREGESTENTRLTAFTSYLYSLPTWPTLCPLCCSLNHMCWYNSLAQQKTNTAEQEASSDCWITMLNWHSRRSGSMKGLCSHGPSTDEPATTLGHHFAQVQDLQMQEETGVVQILKPSLESAGKAMNNKHRA